MSLDPSHGTPNLLAAARGIAAPFVITLRDDLGNPVTTYTGAEALAGVVWAGADQAPALSLAPAWLSASAGTIAVPLSASSTAILGAGRYRVQLKLADNSADLYEGFLEVSDSAGTAQAPTSYGSFDDLLDRAPWVEKLQRPTDLAGFARQRYLARNWFEDLLHRHYRGPSGFSTDYQFGASLFGPLDVYRDGRRSAELQGWLDANRLDVTPSVIEAVTYYALALLCDRQVTPSKDDNGYAASARKFFSRAEAAAALITAEIDSDGDGLNDLTIRLGSFDTLEG